MSKINELKEHINTLESRVFRLVKAYQHLEKENTRLLETLSEKKQLLKAQDLQIRNFQKQVKNANIAELDLMQEHDLTQLKELVNECIKELDELIGQVEQSELA